MTEPGRILSSASYISGKFLFSRRNKRYTAAWFTVIGIAVGFAAIFIVIGIMNGLQSGYLEDIREIQSYHVQAELADGAQPEAVQEDILAIPGVTSAVRYVDTHALVEYRNGQYYPILLRGLEAAALYEDPGFLSHLGLLGEADLLRDRELLISDYLSRVFRTPEGSELQLTVMGTGQVVRHVPLTFSTTVASRFSSGFPEVNYQMVFVAEETVGTILPEQQPSIGIKASSGDVDALKQQVLSIPGVADASTWKEANYGFYSALMLEKYGMMILLSLIFLVVIMNAKSSFEKYVFHKKDDIALLRSVGASKGVIYLVFLIQGAAISCAGLLLGALAGTLSALNISGIIGAVQKLLSLLTGREISFFIQDLPVALYPRELLLLALIVLLLFLLNIFTAIRSLINKPPLEIMRYE